MTITVINIKAVNKAQEYFTKNNGYYQLVELYPLKQEIIAEFTDDSDKTLKYMAFDENGKSGNMWRTLDDAILGSILKLDCINDTKILNMLNTLKG